VAEVQAFAGSSNFTGLLIAAELIGHSTLAARPASRNGSPQMTFLAFLGLIPALLSSAVQSSGDDQVVRRVIVQDEVIFRVPIRPRVSPPIEWIEKKGPKCIPANMVAGAILSGPSSIDFVLRNRARVRALMDTDCPALDFYRNFYLQPDDDYICAKRETIRSRVGGSCRIEKFKSLVPQIKQAKH